MKLKVSKSNIRFIFAISVLLYILIIWFTVFLGISDKELYMLQTVFFIIIIVHEFLHGLVFLLFGASLNNLFFLFTLEKGQCSCAFNNEVSKMAFTISLLLPLIIPFVFLLIYFSSNNNVFLILFLISLLSSIFDLVYFIDIVKIPGDSKIRIIFDEDDSYYISSKTNSKLDNIDFVVFTATEVLSKVGAFNIPKLFYFSKFSIICYIIAIFNLIRMFIEKIQI